MNPLKRELRGSLTHIARDALFLVLNALRLSRAAQWRLAMRPRVGTSIGHDGLPFRERYGTVLGVRYQRQLSLRYRQRHRPGFSADPTRGLWSGATVTYVAMQLAYFLGFSEVLLIGVDHHFETQGPPGKVVSARGADPNHFDPSYFSNGFRWQLPDLETSEHAYSLAGRAFEADGRQMYNATVGGRLEVFPRRPFESFFRVVRTA